MGSSGGVVNTPRMPNPVACLSILAPLGPDAVGVVGATTRFGDTDASFENALFGINLTHMGIRRATRATSGRRAATGGLQYAIVR